MEWKKKLAEWKAAGTEPPESLKEGGFTAGYKPPAAYFNWLFNTTYEALKEIRGNIKKDEWDGKVDSKGGDAADTKVSDFTPSSTPYPIPEAGETIKIIIGKLVKFCNDVKSGCCKVADIVNNCTSAATDKPLAAAVGKVLWDKIVDAVAALGTHKSSADHDGRYYTESEINTKLGGKSDTSHNHDSSYVKKHTVAEVSGIQVGKKETNGYGWIDIYYKGVHEFSIYVENSGTGLIIKPALPLSTRHQYVNVLCQLQQKGNLVVDSGRIVDNCTSDVTYNVLSANQGRILMNKYNQLNSDLTPQAVSVTANSTYIKTGTVICYKIKNMFFLTFSDVVFTKAENFGHKSHLLWTLGSPSPNDVVFILNSYTTHDAVRILISGNKIYGHYDTPSTDYQYYGTVVG